MKASETSIRFPVLGFIPDVDYGEFGHVFPDLDSLTICSGFDFKSGKLGEIELIDADGARWAVKAVTKVRRHGALALWLLGTLLNWQRYRIDYELEPLPSVTLAEVQARVCAVEQVFGDLDMPSEADDAETAARIAKIRGAKTIARVAKLSEWDGF